MRTVKLNRVDTVLAELDYPVDRERAASAFADVTLVLAEGEENLGELVAASGSERFDSADDLIADVYSGLPRNAVGEPFQSEGEG